MGGLIFGGLRYANEMPYDVIYSTDQISFPNEEYIKQ